MEGAACADLDAAVDAGAEVVNVALDAGGELQELLLSLHLQLFASKDKAGLAVVGGWEGG